MNSCWKEKLINYSANASPHPIKNKDALWETRSIQKYNVQNDLSVNTDNAQLTINTLKLIHLDCVSFLKEKNPQLKNKSEKKRKKEKTKKK